MTNRKRTIVTIETRKRTVVRGSSGQTIAWCEQCLAEVSKLEPAEVATFARVTLREGFHRVQTGELHLLAAERGALLICRKLLMDDSSHSVKE